MSGGELKTLQYGLLARAGQTTPKVVRYFVNEGLLDPKRPDPVRQLQLILEMKKAGFTLAEIRVSLPALLNVQKEQLVRVMERISLHITEVSRQHAALSDRLDDLYAFADHVAELHKNGGPLKPENGGPIS